MSGTQMIVYCVVWFVLGIFAGIPIGRETVRRGR